MIGEKFAANPVTVTSSMTLPVFTSPGRYGFGPPGRRSVGAHQANASPIFIATLWVRSTVVPIGTCPR